MTNKKYKMIYDYRKRTSGGFLDAMFLSSLLIIGTVKFTFYSPFH